MALEIPSERVLGPLKKKGSNNCWGREKENFHRLNQILADMMELVDMPGLGSGDYNVCGGSSPSIRISRNFKFCDH